jgi:hypothetical protein
MLLIISLLTTLPLLNPIKTSASFNPSANVPYQSFQLQTLAFCSSKSVLPLCINPLLSNTFTFSFFTPNAIYSLIQEIAAAPAPLTTTLTFVYFFFCNSNAFNNAAALIIAVPC